MTRTILLALICLPLLALAKPDLSEKLGPNIAERGSAFYRFDTVELSSVDGQRQYRIWIGVPQRPAPHGGYPALYMLDGNAAMDTLDEAQLAALDRRDPPVLVAIGYATDLRFDVVARAYDYTPPLPGAEPVIDDLVRERRGGGADVFLQLIEQRIKPAVAARAPIDGQRQTLWGHSYAGLFALHTLFTRPQSFQAYAIADPSLWWQKGFILSEEQTFLASKPALPGGRLLLMRGIGNAEDRPPRAGMDAKVVAARREAMASVPADALLQMSQRLAKVPGLQVQYREFPGLGHGPLLAASLPPALQLASEPGTPSPGERHEQ